MNVFNGAETLRETLDSVLGQSFRDWELIFWDDRSTDGSATILEDYPDRRIRYFLSPEFTMLGQARELAIRQASGEWLAFLDQDDIWLPHKLQKQIGLSNDPRVGLIYGRTLSFKFDRNQRDYDHRHEFQPLPEGDIFHRLFVDSCFICMSSAMLRRTAAVEVGPIPDFIQTTPDYFLFLAVAQRYRARAVQEVVCRYRLHGDSMSKAVFCRMHEEATWLIDRWSESIDPRLASYRRRVHSTIWAVQDMRSVWTFRRGLARLLRCGSILYLLSRPFAIAYRSVRRSFCRPVWKQTSKARLAPSGIQDCEERSGGDSASRAY